MSRSISVNNIDITYDDDWSVCRLPSIGSIFQPAETVPNLQHAQLRPFSVGGGTTILVPYWKRLDDVPQLFNGYMNGVGEKRPVTNERDSYLMDRLAEVPSMKRIRLDEEDQYHQGEENAEGPIVPLGELVEHIIQGRENEDDGVYFDGEEERERQKKAEAERVEIERRNNVMPVNVASAHVREARKIRQLEADYGLPVVELHQLVNNQEIWIPLRYPSLDGPHTFSVENIGQTAPDDLLHLNKVYVRTMRNRTETMTPQKRVFAERFNKRLMRCGKLVNDCRTESNKEIEKMKQSCKALKEMYLFSQAIEQKMRTELEKICTTGRFPRSVFGEFWRGSHENSDTEEEPEEQDEDDCEEE